jgi:long-chain acyl-CoA synthetase
MEMVWLDFDAVSEKATSAGNRVLAGDAVAGAENLVAAIWQVAATRPTHPALLWQGHPLSYDWIRTAAVIVCEYLVSLPEFRPGTRVVLALENSPEYLAAFYGVLLADGVVVPVSPNVEKDRWRHIVQSCTPVAVLSRRREARTVMLEATDRTTALQLNPDTAQTLSKRLAVPPIVNRGGIDLAMIMFTSGSTGAPKGVMLSHRNLLSNARSILGYLPICQDDRALVVLPFCHAFGNSVLQSHLLAGATLILDGSLAIPATVVQALRERHASSFAGVPEVYAMLLRFAPWQSGQLPQLRYMTVAGGEMRAELAEQVSQIIAPAELYVMYGQTEATARLAYLPPKLRRTHRESIGKAIPGVELSIVNERGAAVTPGEVGLLQARGDNIMLGYWQDPHGTEAVLRDGWLSTGDFATVDDEGFIYLRGRANRLIKLQSNRVHPAEIEDVVARHFPGAQVAVLPYEVDELTRLALFCTPPRSTALTDRDIYQVCVRELPYYKVPQFIEVLDCLPLNGGLKVDREQLAHRVQSQSRAKEIELCHQ